MIELYPEIRLVHMSAVYASGILVLVRGVTLFVPAGWLATLLLVVTYTLDTVLLTAALMLMTVGQQYPFVEGWLTVKVLLLAVFLTLRTVAFSEGPALHLRKRCWIASLTAFAFIVSVAWTRSPLGLFAG